MARGRKTGGRQKGAKNKRPLAITYAVKEALVESFARLGGIDALVEWGKANQGDYYKIWARMLPTEIKTPDGESLLLKIIDLRGDDEETTSE